MTVLVKTHLQLFNIPAAWPQWRSPNHRAMVLSEQGSKEDGLEVESLLEGPAIERSEGGANTLRLAQWWYMG